MRMVSWFFAVEGFFQHALDEILELKAVLAGVDFEAAVEIGGDFEGRSWWWFWRGECHGVKLRQFRKLAALVLRGL